MKDKTKVIFIILLWAMLPICAFGLSFLSEAFIALGIFCGIGATFWLVIFLDQKQGKRPNYFFIGTIFCIMGVASLVGFEHYRAVTIPLSLAMIVIGAFLFKCGRQERQNEKKAKEKKPLNAKIYMGIGLLVAGYIATILLFEIDPLLMGIGYVLDIAGLVVLGMGIGQRKKPQQITVKTLPVDTAFPKMKTYTYCQVCGNAIIITKPHRTDDGRTVCVRCLTEQLREAEVPEASTSPEPVPGWEMSLELKDAVSYLRSQILEKLAKQPETKYQLASLLWQDAANCFPNGSRAWDGAWFYLDLKTGHLFAEVSTYPNQFGAYFQDSFSISAEEFQRIAKQYNMPQHLQAFACAEDWTQLFDGKLQKAVGVADRIQKKRAEEREKREIQENAIKIPASCQDRSPRMHIAQVKVQLSQAYSKKCVCLEQKDDQYRLVYESRSPLRSEELRYVRTLSVAEAVWLEDRIQAAIENPDNSTWQSLPGGDSMDIEIYQNYGSQVSMQGIQPLNKHMDLQRDMRSLAQYGSCIAE